MLGRKNVGTGIFRPAVPTFLRFNFFTSQYFYNYGITMMTTVLFLIDINFNQVWEGSFFHLMLQSNGGGGGPTEIRGKNFFFCNNGGKKWLFPTTRTCPFRQIDPTTVRTDSGNANAGVFGCARPLRLVVTINENSEKRFFRVT